MSEKSVKCFDCGGAMVKSGGKVKCKKCGKAFVPKTGMKSGGSKKASGSKAKVKVAHGKALVPVGKAQRYKGPNGAYVTITYHKKSGS